MNDCKPILVQDIKLTVEQQTELEEQLLQSLEEEHEVIKPNEDFVLILKKL